MLDLDHPKSQGTLAAARVEDEMRRQLVAWLSDDSAGAMARHQILQTLLPKLEAINASHFGASKRIYATLDAIVRTVQGADAAAAWQAFSKLDGPGDNFGTWAI